MIGPDTTRAWLHQEEDRPVIDWARIPPDQIDAVKAAILAGEEEDAYPAPPVTAGDAVRDWFETNRRGGYVTWEQMEAGMTVLAEWVDRCSLPIAEGEAALAEAAAAREEGA